MTTVDLLYSVRHARSHIFSLGYARERGREIEREREKEFGQGRDAVGWCGTVSHGGINPPLLLIRPNKVVRLEFQTRWFSKVKFYSVASDK